MATTRLRPQALHHNIKNPKVNEPREYYKKIFRKYRSWTRAYCIYFLYISV